MTTLKPQRTDQPWLVNGFTGTWNFSDHSLIPHALQDFIMDKLSTKLSTGIKDIPLEKINKLMNDTWEGPGSLAKLKSLCKPWGPTKTAHN
jgi:hypothetical protein